MGIETIFNGLEFTNFTILLILMNIVLIIIAIFFLIRLRRTKNKAERKAENDKQPKKEKTGELTGIADIKPEEFNLGRLGLNKDFLATPKPPETKPVIAGTADTNQALNISGIQQKIEPVVTEAAVEAKEVPASPVKQPELTEVTPEVTEIDELEDELPEEFTVFHVRKLEIPQPDEPPVISPEKTEEKASQMTLPEQEKTSPFEQQFEKAEEKKPVLDEPLIKTQENHEAKQEGSFNTNGIKLFGFEKAEKKPEEFAFSAPPELLTAPAPGKPIAMPESISATAEQAEKTSKRKSLF